MAWTTPLTAVSNAALTAAQWNASVRDDMLTMPTALATTAGSHFAATGANSIAERIPAVASLTTAGTTTSTTYTALLTGVGGTGLLVTVTTGQSAFWAISSAQTTSINGSNVFSSVAISGASSIPANAARAISVDTTGQTYHGISVLENGLTAGSNNFIIQQAVTSGTGTYSNRRIQVIPF